MEAAWLVLREALERIAHGGDTLLDIADVHRFCTVYRAHMAMEEAHLFPLARSILKTPVLAELGKTMAKRRGVRT